MKKLNIDQTNILLMIASCAIAYVLPFELVLVSYAFLGPAHYLTQISWLHDRTYFTEVKWLWVPLAFLAGLMAFVDWQDHQLIVIYTILCLALSMCAALALAKSWKNRGLVALGLMLVLIPLFKIYPPFAIAFAMLLPTVIHIYFFTGIFILLGAVKSKSAWGLTSFATFLVCGGLFFIVSPSDIIISMDFVNRNAGFFDSLADYLARLFSFGGTVDGNSMLGFLSFAYTYHYLNWFSKTEIIKWHQIPRHRLIVIIILYLCGIGAYLIDYKTGFAILLFLSVLHVVLELPLDIISIRNLSATLTKLAH